MNRHEVSENLIERSLEIQEQIDQAEKCIDDMDIKGLLDLGMIDRRIFKNWERAEENEQDLVDTHGRAYSPSFEHYNRAMEKADKNIKRLKKEVNDLIKKSKSVLRQASRVADAYMNKTSSKETWKLKSNAFNTVSQETALDELDADCVRAGLSCQPNFNSMEVTVEGSSSVINKVMSSPSWKRKVEKVANAKTAASGNYGFTKAVQNDVEVALRKLQKKVDQLARIVESKHPEAGTYFSTRCQGSNCNASKALGGACLLNQKPKRMVAGPLGFKPSCARASHKAITDLILYSGEVAHSLHKKSRNHVPYLETHSKKKRCPLTRLLLENYPVEIL